MDTTRDALEKAIIRILSSFNQDLEKYGYFGPSMGISENDFEEVAQEIAALATLSAAPQGVGMPSKAHADYLAYLNGGMDRALGKLFGVKRLMVGSLKVKDTSSLKYKGLVLPVLGYYMKWSNVGLHSDSWDEYRVSLVGTEFDKEYGETTIATGDIEWVKAEPWDAAKSSSPAEPDTDMVELEKMAKEFLVKYYQKLVEDDPRIKDDHGRIAEQNASITLAPTLAFVRTRLTPLFRAVSLRKGEYGELAVLVDKYLGEYDNPVPDHMLRRQYREQMRAMIQPEP